MHGGQFEYLRGRKKFDIKWVIMWGKGRWDIRVEDTVGMKR